MRKGLVVVFLLLMASLLAGCSETKDPVDPAPPEADAGSMVAFGTCRFTCFEPTIAVDGAGRVYVTAGSDQVWRGDPIVDAFEWTNITPPDAGPVPGDRIVDVSPNGRVFVSELQIGQAGAPTARVVASDDNGTTWTVEHTFSSGVTGQNMDRQWLAFGPDDDVVLVYKNQFEGLYAHYSSDGGDTFSQGALVAVQQNTGVPGTVSAHTVIIAGRPVVAELGVTLIPMVHPARAAAFVGPVGVGGLSVVQWSAGRPPLETPVLVGGTQATGTFFPSLALHDSTYWLAWQNYDGSLGIVNSANIGEWQAVPPPQHGQLTSSPWLEIDEGGTVHVAWTETGANGNRLMHATGPGEWAVSQVSLLFGEEPRLGHTDFAHFALLGDEALFPVAQDNATGVKVVRVPPTL